MIKNKIRFINLLTILSFALFLLSCSSDTPSPSGSNSAPITLAGEWVSGNLSYHIDTDCASSGMTLDDFADSTIVSNLEVHAWTIASLLCDGEAFVTLGFNTEEDCIENTQIDQIETLTGNLDANDIDSYKDKISSGYEYNNMILTMFDSPSVYSVSYDGQCLGYLIETADDCLSLSNTSWAEESGCTITTKTTCESNFVNGTWDDGFEGSWEEGLEGNYTLDDFEMFDETEKELIFDGSSIFIIIDENQNKCICDDDVDEIPNGSSACVLNSQCIWIEKNCVSLSFSK